MSTALTDKTYTARPHSDVCDVYYHGICLDPLAMPRMGYEQDEVDMVRAVLRPDMRVLLAGFGKGYLALICATIVGGEAVFAYEAEPVLAASCGPDVRYMGTVIKPKHGAITVRAKTDGPKNSPLVRTLWRADTWESSTLVPMGKEHRTRRVMVPGYDINEEIRRYGITALVLDVEGYEATLLAGCNLRPISAIVLEMHHEKVDPDALVGLLKDAGFTTLEHQRHPKYPVSVIGMARV